MKNAPFLMKKGASLMKNAPFRRKKGRPLMKNVFFLMKKDRPLMKKRPSLTKNVPFLMKKWSSLVKKRGKMLQVNSYAICPKKPSYKKFFLPCRVSSPLRSRCLTALPYVCSACR